MYVPPMASVGMLTNEFVPLSGGIATYAMELARAAVQLGHRVVLLAPAAGLRDSGADRSLPFEVIRYRGPGASIRDYGGLLPAALKIARRTDIDLLHACDPSSIAALSVTQPVHRRAFVATIHGSEVNRAGRGIYGQVAKLLGFYTRPAHIFANSEYTRSLLLRHCPAVAASRASVTPLGVDASWFEPAAPSSWLATQGVRPDERLIACVARLTPRKGQAVAIDVFSRLPARLRQNSRLLLIGATPAADTAYGALLRQRAEPHGDRVLLAGKLPAAELRAIYARSDAFLLPGGQAGPWVEGFGLVFLEAAAQGLPAVAGRQGGVAEAVVDEETGLLAPAADADALRTCLERLLDDAALRTRLGEAARARARTFTWERCAALTYGSA
jgi:glycosyltransferase involved in cell wall biosynthesis